MRRTPEADASGFCGCYSLGLTLADIGTFVFCNEGQHLQHDVAEECAHQILATARVWQGHVEHDNVGFFLFCQNPSLIWNFGIVPPPVDQCFLHR